jgi:hypothetical protein
MATTTEIPTIHSVPPPVNGTEPAAEPKRPRGRPMKCRQCGENIDPTRNHECTPPPAVTEEADEDFWLMLSNFTVEEWNHLTAYLYRVMPRIDRKANGKPINLGCYSTAFTRDDIMSEHGSGVYRIDLTQLEPASSRSRRIAREVFTIINPKYPPIVPPGDWVDDKVNDMWKWGAPAGVSGVAAASGYPPGFNIKDVYDSAFQMAKALTPPPPPAKDDSAMTTLIGKLLDASLKPAPAPTPPDNTATNALIAFLEKQNDRLADDLKELRKVQNAPPPPQKNIIEQVKELRPMLSEFVDMFEAKTGNQPWWAAPLQTVMEGIGEAIPTVVTMLQNGNGHPAPPQQWNPPALAAPAAPTIQAPPTTNGTPGAPPPPAVEQTDEQKKMQGIYQRWSGFILFIANQMVSEFKMDHEGHGGYHFRDWFLEGHGLFKWDDLRKEVGPELLSTMIGQHPELSLQMSPKEDRDFFLEEFFTKVGEEPDDEPPSDGVIVLGGSDAA